MRHIDEPPHLTREEACFERLRELMGRGRRDKTRKLELEDVQHAARECPEVFHVKDKHGRALLYHVCYSDHVTAEILDVFHEVNPDAFEQSTVDYNDGPMTPAEKMTFNMNAPHDAFRSLLQKTKPARDAYVNYLELRFLCNNEKFPVTAVDIQSIVDDCPEATSMKFRPEERRSQHHRTLLHILCCNPTATLEVISILFGAYPAAISIDGGIGLPLHRACMNRGLPADAILFLFEQHPEALQVNISFHGLPLHHYLSSRKMISSDSCEHFGLDLGLIRRFMDDFPQALQILPQEEGLYGTPLHLLADYLWKTPDDLDALELFRDMVRISPAALEVQSPGRHPTFPILHHVCKSNPVSVTLVEILVKANPSLMILRTPQQGLLPIHVVCERWHGACSIDLLRLMIDHDRTLAMEPASDGELPIHFLLQGYTAPSKECVELLVECNAGMLQVAYGIFDDLPIHMACRKSSQDDTVLKTGVYLVEKYPESTKLRNNEGLTPLDIAVTSSRYLNDHALVSFLLQKDPAVAKSAGGERMMTPFHRACRSGSLEIIKKIHELYPFLIQQRDANQALPLHHAVVGNQNGDVLIFLMQTYPTAIGMANIDGFLPLHSACTSDFPTYLVDLFELLIKCFPTAIHTAGRDGRYPIQILVANPEFKRRGHKALLFLAEQLPYSISRLDAEERNAMHIFCQQDWSCEYSCDEAKETLSKLNQLNADAIRHESSEFGLPIHCACVAGCCVNLLKHLINLYPESIDHRHNTLGLPLHCSTRSENKDAFQYLLEKRYESYIENHGKFLLHALLADDEIDRKESLSKEVIQLDRARRQCIYFHNESSFEDKERPIIEVKDNHGRLPLHLAVSSDLNVEFIEDLISKYPDALSERDDEGKTPLHLAFQNGARPDIIEMLLLQSQAPLTIQDNNKCLPFHLGCQHHREHGFMERLIRDIGYQYEHVVDFDFLPEQIDKDGDLPLHKACIGGNLQCIPSLAGTYPLALRTRNSSGMLPVYLLCLEAGKDGDDFEERDEAYVSAIFDLLRRNPESILVENQA